MTVFYLIKP